MTIVIDLGTTDAHPVTQYIPDWFLDVNPADMTPERLAHDYAYHLIGAMQNPKKLETVRKHLLAQWGFLSILADMHPEVFDEVITAFAERVLG